MAVAKRKSLGVGLAATVAVAGVALGGGGVPRPAAAGSSAVPAASPNVVVIMTDDQTVEQMVALPATRSLLGDTGVTFDDAVVSYPMCCPSRASFFTGQYTQNNGVRQNAAGDDDNPLPRETAPVIDVEAWPAFAADAEARSLAVALEGSGYHTGLLGKYLNGYRITAGPPVGWSDWRASGSPASSFWNTRLNVNGTVTEFPEQFQTDLFADQAVDMIDDASASGRPFFLAFNFSAPHTSNDGRPTFAPRHESLYADETAPRSDAFDEVDTSDQPAFLRQRYPRLTSDQIDAVDERWRNGLRSLAAVDEAVAGIVHRLDTDGELEDTVIVFTSDNGFFYGEHRIPIGKYLPYEPAVHVPLIVSGPAVAASRRGTESDLAVANVDLSPTILDLAGVEPLSLPDGRSFAPVLAGDTVPWQAGTGGSTHPRPVYLMGVASSLPARIPVTYSGVRSSDGWVYVRWEDRERSVELYDLAADPEQIDNLADDPAHAVVRSRLERQRRFLVRCAGRSCDVPPYGYLDLPHGAAMPSWFGAAHWADTTGVDVAFGDGTFGPVQPGRRGALVSWLWRYSGSPVVATSTPFADVGPGLRPAVDWALDAGILSGGQTLLRPRQGATRATWASWLWALAGRPEPPSTGRPRDVGASHWAVEAITWLTSDPPGPDGPIASGYADGTFRPAAEVTRAQAVGWLMRVDGSRG